MVTIFRGVYVYKNHKIKNGASPPTPTLTAVEGGGCRGLFEENFTQQS